MTSNDKPWFAPKRFGYGAGLPVAWQGWAVLAGYLVAVGGAAFLVERSPLAFATVLVAATAALLPISALKTRGGWRWRWGEEH